MCEIVTYLGDTLGNSRKTLLTSVVQLVIMLTSAIILSKIGTINTVWFAFVITEVLVAALAFLLMKLVYSRTIQGLEESPEYQRISLSSASAKKKSCSFVVSWTVSRKPSSPNGTLPTATSKLPF